MSDKISPDDFPGVAHEDEKVPIEVARHYADDNSTLREMLERGRPISRLDYLDAAGIERDPATGELNSDTIPDCFRLRDE